ncbi:uncharacterized protein [Physcomitrium patens]|uniref:uncharacterized protein n=1 Tax=Physcomitrium patens TaxID=3218 RepID=UPI003CCDAF3C
MHPTNPDLPPSLPAQIHCLLDPRCLARRLFSAAPLHLLFFNVLCAEDEEDEDRECLDTHSLHSASEWRILFCESESLSAARGRGRGHMRNLTTRGGGLPEDDEPPSQLPMLFHSSARLFVRWYYFIHCRRGCDWLLALFNLDFEISMTS